MKAMKTTSARSLQKTSTRDFAKGVIYEMQIDFVKELQDACQKYECYGIVVNRAVQNDEFYKNLKTEQKKLAVSKRMSVATTHVSTATDETRPAAADDASADSASTQAQPVDPVVAIVDAFYDAQNELVEVSITRVTDIPRRLIQSIALLVPYFRFLAKISIVKSRISGYSLHELTKISKVSCLTDICLDGSYLSESNYATLLSEKTKLRNLSLSRCRINDEDLGAIASKLHFKSSAGKTLMALNLSCNGITDAGVKLLALALRSNRCLRYLNLASNRITDDGALPLFDTLREFPLLDDDIMQKRARYIDYLRKKRAIYMKYFEDGDSRDHDEVQGRKSATPRKSKIGLSPKKTGKKDGGDVDLVTKIEMMSLEILGLFFDPFGPECVKVKNGVTYCLGNLMLCYLNLAYNSLSYLSIARLHAVLLYQSSVKKPTDYGLLRVVIDGNPLPVCCSEFDVIGQALTNSVFRQMTAGERRRASVPHKRK